MWRHLLVEPGAPHLNKAGFAMTPHSIGRAKKTVLIVEDDDGVAFVMERALEDRYIVFRAANVRVAREILATFAIDVIVLDWRLGKERGRDLLETLARRKGIVSPPTIVASGDTSEEEAKNHGAASVLHKPFTLAELSAAIERVLQGRSSERT